MNPQQPYGALPPQPQPQSQPPQPQALPVVPASPQPQVAPMPSPAQLPQAQPQLQPNGSALPPVVPPPSLGQPPQIPQPYAVPPVGPPSASGGKKLLPIAIAALLLVLLVGGGIALLVKGAKAPSAPTPSAGQPNSSNSAVDLATVRAFSLVTPADMSGFSRDLAAKALETYDTANNSCTLSFGSIASPGGAKSMKAILQQQASQMQQQGLDVTGPDQITSLTLKDHDLTTKQYSLPTFGTVVRSGSKTVITHSSGVVLGSGRLVEVVTSCSAKNGTLTDSALTPLDQRAAAITVKRQ